MVEISKSDWKLFRERIPEWQENYMGRLIEEYMRKSEALWDILTLIRQKVITVGDLDGFSEELKNTVKELLDMT